MRVELDEIQGNVVHAYGNRFPVARYVLLRIRDDRVDDARRAVAQWIDEVTFGKPTDDQPRVNLALTYPGLVALGVPQDQLDRFPRDFQEGAWQRSEQLDGPAGRAEWEPGIGSAHLLLSCHARDETGLDRRIEELLGPVQDAVRHLQRPACRAARPGFLRPGGGRTQLHRPSEPRALRLRGRLLAASDRRRAHAQGRPRRLRRQRPGAARATSSVRSGRTCSSAT